MRLTFAESFKADLSSWCWVHMHHISWQFDHEGILFPWQCCMFQFQFLESLLRKSIETHLSFKFESSLYYFFHYHKSPMRWIRLSLNWQALYNTQAIAHCIQTVYRIESTRGIWCNRHAEDILNIMQTEMARKCYFMVISFDELYNYHFPHWKTSGISEICIHVWFLVALSTESYWAIISTKLHVYG